MLAVHYRVSSREEVRRYYGKLPARMYCTITSGGVTGTDTSDLKLHTFGFEFYIMTNGDEKIVLEQLEQSNRETGIAHYLGRADVFERLGLIKLAVDEYTKALEQSPNNELIESRLERLRYYRRF